MIWSFYIYKIYQKFINYNDIIERVIIMINSKNMIHYMIIRNELSQGV